LAFPEATSCYLEALIASASAHHQTTVPVLVDQSYLYSTAALNSNCLYLFGNKFTTLSAEQTANPKPSSFLTFSAPSLPSVVKKWLHFISIAVAKWRRSIGLQLIPCTHRKSRAASVIRGVGMTGITPDLPDINIPRKSARAASSSTMGFPGALSSVMKTHSTTVAVEV